MEHIKFFKNYSFKMFLIILYKYGLYSAIETGISYIIELKQAAPASSTIVNKVISGLE